MNNNIYTDNEVKRIATQVSILCIIGNVILSLIKFVAGIVGHSEAMLSDAIHSTSDVVGNLIALVGIVLSRKQSDVDHEYGHDRLECVASIVLSIILVVTGVKVGLDGLQKVFVTNDTIIVIPNVIALVVALISIVVKEGMFQYTKYYAKKICSNALMACAWDHRSDAFSSVGAFIGILGAMLGYRKLDIVASILICVFIIRTAILIFKDSIDKMVDKACDKKTEAFMKNTILKIEGVYGIDLLQTRLFGSKVYVDVEISVDKNLTVLEGHEIEEVVHQTIEHEFPLVKHCMVHVNPV